MANTISDITVNISVEDVINSAELGIPLLFLLDSTDTTNAIPYKECYSLDEVKTAVKGLLDSSDETIKANGQKFVDAATLAFLGENKPEKIAVLNCGIETFDTYIEKDFWQVILLNPYVSGEDGNAADIVKLSKYIETAEPAKLLFVTRFVEESELETNADENLEALKDNELTVVLQSVGKIASTSTANDNYFAANLVANASTKKVGSMTYKNFKIKGCKPYENMKKSTLDVIHANNYNALVHKAGYDVTSEGKCINGEYIDIVESKYWLIKQIQYQLQQALIINDKVPYTNQGINYLASIVVNILNDAYNNGMINTTEDGLPDYKVNFAPRSATKAEDREKRKYVEGNFSFGLAGAIHEVTVNGIILI